MSRQEIGEQGKDVRSLRAAIRKARLSQADRTDVIVDLREAEQARLDLLLDELQSVFDEMPERYDQFECALVPGDPARLWIDMLGYVVMGADKRTYRLIKEARDGRHVLHETLDVGDMANHVTDYIAHRIIEVERALESDKPQVAMSDNPKPQGYSGLAVFLSFGCGALLGILALFLFGVLLTPG